MWDSIFINMRLGKVDCRSAIGVQGGKIAWIGAREDLPDAPAKLARNVHDVAGALGTPGLVDCHTHLVYGGNRAAEFEMRLNGATYEEIARAGGGIVSTVRATRAATEDKLYEAALPRLQNLMREGVTAIEIKSGYGLDTASEGKILRVATRLRDDTGLRVQRTFLGAHTLPPEYRGKADDYIAFVCDEMMPTLHKEGLIDAVDAFCENIGFSAKQTERVFKAARDLGLPVKLHAEQLSNQGGAALAARFGALSADHLEYLDEDGVKAMAGAGTVAVLLPGAFYFLREKQLPPVDLFRKHGVPMAIATDHNPGSSPANSLLLMMNMACTLFRMTPEEALVGVTKNAAIALGYNDIGAIEVGLRADFVFWDVNDPAELSYRFGVNPCAGVVCGGLYTDFAPSRNADNTDPKTGRNSAARFSL